MGPSFVNEIDSASNFFDQIDDLIMFPPDVEPVTGCGGSNDIPAMWDVSLPDTDNIFSGDNLLTELSVPYEDIVQLEWLSAFVEDSFSSQGMTIEKQDNLCTKKDVSVQQFQTSSPVSVLESTSSSYVGTNSLSPSQQRARSKRPRPSTFNPRAGIQLISSSFIETPRPFKTVENLQVSPVKIIVEATAIESQKKRIKITSPKLTSETPQMVRKCMHCEITKTPQWRAGPMGAKTLCNACGVRYKSGRLFPEYRPAASPTFIPSLHSNSHKKVIEMRTKTVDSITTTTTV